MSNFSFGSGTYMYKWKTICSSETPTHPQRSRINIDINFCLFKLYTYTCDSHISAFVSAPGIRQRRGRLLVELRCWCWCCDGFFVCTSHQFSPFSFGKGLYICLRINACTYERCYIVKIKIFCNSSCGIIRKKCVPIHLL